MTRKKWLACTDPEPMLEFLRPRASGRKLRLFAVACCRRILPLMTDERSRQAVEVAERYADELADEEQLEEAYVAASAEEDSESRAMAAAAFVVACDDDQAARFAPEWAAYAADEANPSPRPRKARWGTAGTAERAAQVELLRCVFGDPFRPVTLNPSWVTPAVTGLAETIYQERDFDLLLVLADALEEAGCDNTEVLNHCRGNHSHARGCWIVDLLRARNE
jgi:hypothetical protein